MKNESEYREFYIVWSCFRKFWNILSLTANSEKVAKTCNPMITFTSVNCF